MSVVVEGAGRWEERMSVGVSVDEEVSLALIAFELPLGGYVCLAFTLK